MQSLYVFLASSAVHCIFELVQREIKDKTPTYKEVHMKRLCDTRWTCRADSVKAVCNGYQAIIETLERVVRGTIENVQWNRRAC